MKRSLLATITLTVLIGLMGCSDKEDTPTGSSRGNPKDYLPTKVGTTWTYKIEIGETEPVSYNEVRWPQGEGSTIRVATRGRFLPLLIDNPAKTYTLSMAVTNAKVKKQGQLEYPIGAEIKILTDELGIYEKAKKVMFAASTSGRFMAHEVVTLDPSSAGAPRRNQWGTWGSEDGFTMKIYFFGASPGTQISLGETDSLLFNGIAQVPGQSKKGLHFTRKVRAPKDADGSILSKAFTEDVWFVKGKGLVRLQQKVEGVVSMTWTLESFAQPFTSAIP